MGKSRRGGRRLWRRQAEHAGPSRIITAGTAPGHPERDRYDLPREGHLSMSRTQYTRRLAAKLALAATALGLSLPHAMAQPVTLDFWDMNWAGTEYPVAAQALV